MRIVEALAQLPPTETQATLLNIATSDDSGEVRSQAALAMAATGKHVELMQMLNRELQDGRGGAALPAFVTVADRYGIPDEVKGYPAIAVGINLIQRRWQHARAFLMERAWKTAIAGGLSMAVLQILLFLSVLLSPEKFQEILAVVSLPAWIFINVITGVVWGGLLGAGLGFLTALSDGVFHRDAGKVPRAWYGGLAGFIHSGFILFTASATGTWASVPPRIYVPVYLLYGFLAGAVLTFVIPRQGEKWNARQQASRFVLVCFSLLLISTIAVWIAYGMQFQTENAIPDLQAFILLSLLFPFGLLLALRGKREGAIRATG